MKETLGDVGLIYFAFFGFIIRVGVQGLVGDNMVCQKSL